MTTLEEAVSRFEWELGAYVVMRNHFHLAVRTPHPNLSAGMQWLQATFAIRFNRMRAEIGHLFQGRYKALLLEDDSVWARVADYIHLNPLRAHVVKPEHMASFRWSSLSRFTQGKGFKGLTSEPWLTTLGWTDSNAGWLEYVEYLMGIHAREQALPEKKRENLSRGWALGSDEWKQELVRKLGSEPENAIGAEYRDPKEVQEMRWESRLNALLVEAGYTEEQLSKKERGAMWRIRLADQLRQEMGVPVVWLANRLRTGRPSSLRTSLWRLRLNTDK